MLFRSCDPFQLTLAGVEENTLFGPPPPGSLDAQNGNGACDSSSGALIGGDDSGWVAKTAAIAKCELSFIDRQAIDLKKAEAQHGAYQQLLAQLGAMLIILPAQPALPDSMFVEDPALVLDELAVIFPLGAESRRPEAASIERALCTFRRIARVELPGTVEGGDTLHVDRRIFVGQTRRTNAEGIRQLTALLAPFRYEVIPVTVSGCLHLKSAVTYIGGDTLLANRGWFDTTPFSGFKWLDVDPAEPHAANALALGQSVIFPASFPRTRARLEAAGFHVTPIDISELQKAESGLTCSSLLFNAEVVVMEPKVVGMQ